MSDEINFTEVPGYFTTYIDKTEGAELIQCLIDQKISTLQFLESLPSDLLNYAYADNKWTISQVLGHLIDCERIFAYRALCFARGEQEGLPGFDQDNYVLESNVNTWSLKQLVEEYEAVRNATISFYKNLDDQLLQRKGTFSNNQLSVEQIGRVILGHEIHHLEVIKDRYLV